jgi:hypothetical protein
VSSYKPGDALYERAAVEDSNHRLIGTVRQWVILAVTTDDGFLGLDGKPVRVITMRRWGPRKQAIYEAIADWQLDISLERAAWSREPMKEST